MEAKGRDDLAATGASNGGRKHGHARGEERDKRAGDEAIRVHGPCPRERGARRPWPQPRSTHGRRGDTLLPDGLHHGDSGSTEVLEFAQLRAGEAGEDGRREVAMGSPESTKRSGAGAVDGERDCGEIGEEES